MVICCQMWSYVFNDSNWGDLLYFYFLNFSLSKYFSASVWAQITIFDIFAGPSSYWFSLKKRVFRFLYPGISMKFKSAIFRKNSILDPGSNDRIGKKQISFRFLYPCVVPGYKIKFFDSWPRAWLQRFTVCIYKCSLIAYQIY